MPEIAVVTPVKWRVVLACGHIISYDDPECDEEPVPGGKLFCRPCELKQQAQERDEREAIHQLADDALRDVTRELRRRGIDARYYHSGGGCMGVLIAVTPQHEWLFGLADVCWGGDFSDSDTGHLFSVQSSYPSHTKIETVADWIWTHLALVPFTDPVAGVLIENPYYDTTKRFCVNPWEGYGIPYPAGVIPSHLNSLNTCDNCGGYFQHHMPNPLCTRCQHPVPD